MRRIAFITILIAALSVLSAAEFETIEDLNGHDIGVQTAVLYEEFQYYTMPNDMILALQSGKVDGYLIEEVSYGVQKKNHPELTVLEEPAGYIDATCIIGNNAKQDRLLSELNAFIRESHENGMLAELYDYWIADFDPVNDKCDTTGFTGENGTITVAVEGGYEPASCALALRGVGDYAAFELYIGHCACYLGNTIGLAAVDVLIGEVVEHIAIGANVELARQKLGTLLSYPGQVLYVHFVKRGHLAATYQRAASRQAPNLAGRLFLCFRGCLR